VSNIAPHIVQYQGSKRVLAPQILKYIPKDTQELVEPFAGMAAITIASSQRRLVNHYVVNDINKPLIDILENAVTNPEKLIARYSLVWKQQFEYGDDHVRHYYEVRDHFNYGDRSAENMLYLLARCVKGAVRYNNKNEFNQSPDKRRHGTNPDTLAKNVRAVSYLLKGRTTFCSSDYQEILESVGPKALVYMDPPYQGVTNSSDNRYCSGVPFEEFVKAVTILDSKGIKYIISYDGECGDKKYGKDLPNSLGCKKFLLNAGLSSQATLLGKKKITREALYVSEGLIERYKTEEPLIFEQMCLLEAV